MKNRKSLFCLLLVLMLFIGIGTASAQGPGGLETNEDNAYVTTSALNTVSSISLSSSPCNYGEDVLVITYGVGTYSAMVNLANTLINLGYNVTYLPDPANGSITSTMNSGTFEQVWLYDGETQLRLNDTDAQTIADWYNNTAHGNIVVDARSYGAYYRIITDAPLIENIAKAFGLRCENGLWIGTDHHPGWAYNGNKLLSTIGYGTVTGIQTDRVVAGNTSAELLSTPNVVVPSTLHADASPGIAPNGTQPDGVVLERLLWNSVDNKTLTSYSLTTNFCDDAPVITLLGSDHVTVEIDSVYTDAGAIACDYVDGNITGSIVTGGSVDNTTVGTYTITYNVNDSSNNSAVQVTRTVYVVDSTVYVSFDIKPGSCPNPLNLKSKGVLPVAILGTADFDVTLIDPESVTISYEGNGTGVVRWALEDVGTPFDGEPCDCHELGPDGYMDMTLKFDTQGLIEALGLEGMSGDVCLTISGNLAEEYGGTAFEGNDCVRIK